MGINNINGHEYCALCALNFIFLLINANAIAGNEFLHFIFISIQLRLLIIMTLYFCEIS